MTTDTRWIYAAIAMTLCAFLTTCDSSEVKDAQKTADHTVETIKAAQARARLDLMQRNFDKTLLAGVK